MGFVGDVLQGKPNQFQATAPTIAQQQQQNYQAPMNETLAQQQNAYGASNNLGNQQTAYADALRAQMAGNGPSLAQGMLNKATDRNIAQMASAVGSARGLNPAQAARLIGQNTAAMQQDAAGQAAQQRMQEQLAAT